MPPTLLDDAVLFATRAHHGQRRRYTDMPYIGHCLEVMELVGSVPHTEAMLAAAVLHDTLEDTHVTEKELLHAFGDEITRMVILLSDLEEGNRATRKRLTRIRLAGAPGPVQTIKLADLISNTRTIVQHDKNFAVTYLREIRELMPFLTKGDPDLYSRAVASLSKGEAAISEFLGRPFP